MNKVGFTLGAVLLAVLMSVNAFAAVNVTIQSSKDQVAVGEAFDITIMGTATAAESIAAGALAINFTPTTATVTGVTSGFTFAILPAGTELASSPLRPGLLDMTGTGAAVGTDKVMFTISCTGAAVGDATFEFNIEATETNELIDTAGVDVRGTLGTAKTVTVVANRNPVATESALTTDEDTSADGTMAATDPDGDALNFAVTVQPTLGTVKVNDAAKGTFTYTPNKDANGTDNFTFEVTDGKGGKGGAFVAITITAKNDVPAADDLAVETAEDTEAKGNVTAVDADKDAVTFGLAAQATSGVATVNADGSFTYVPNKDFNGTDSFSFTAADPNGGKGTGKVSVTVTAVNDKPVAEKGKATWVLSDPKTFTGTLVGTDVDKDVLTFKIVNPPTQGTLTVDAKGVYTFKPNADANPGPDTFTFSVNDGKMDSDPATIEVAIESGAHTLTLNIVPTAGGKVKAGGNTIPDGGKVVVEDGKAQDFTTTANELYFALSARVVWADGTKTFTKIADNKFTVKDVKQDGVLTVTFKAQYKIIISSSPMVGGYFCLSTEAYCYNGMEKGFMVNGGVEEVVSFNPYKGWMIDEVKIDGVVNTTAASDGRYTFPSVDKDHTVEVVFTPTWEYHSADMNTDNEISMPELLRVIQLFNTNAGKYMFVGDAEDGYVSGDDSAKRPEGMQHSADSDNNWEFSLSELLRVIQFWSLGGYHIATPADAGFPTKDGFAPGK